MNEYNLLPVLNTQALGYIEDLFGGLVPEAGDVSAQLTHRLERDGSAWDNWRVRVGGSGLAWTMGVHWPAGHQNGAVLLSPDACWPLCVNPEATREAGSHGVALAWFNRLELAQDAPDAQRTGPLFEHWPEGRFGAIAAWAWGLQRCVDALLLTGRTQAGRIGVVGHSRGGKAALLAGATDARIGATISHNSGIGGAASLQHAGAGSESLNDLAARFPHWLGPHAAEPQTQQRITACDSLPLLRAIAPRGLCLLQASDDFWANPDGTRHNVEQLRPEWEALNAADRLQWLERTGGHPMTGLDWQRAAAFVQHVVLPPSL